MTASSMPDSRPAPLDLADYREQSAPVASRFRRLYERPVILDVRGLSRAFHTERGSVVALQDVTFRAHRRELICFIGASGCGKSTLVRVIAGLERPTEGQVLLDGKEVRGPGRDRGMVFQSYTLFPWRTVLQNVMFGLELDRRKAAETRDDAREWIELVGLARFADAYPHQLSGGMKQRVAIARALANRPRILLMDEPFGALDAQTRCQMQTHLLEIWKRVDVTILFVTHDLDEAIYLADRIVVMGPHPGRVLEIVEVPVPRPRDPSHLLGAPFLATKRRLESLIFGARAAALDVVPRFRSAAPDEEIE